MTTELAEASTENVTLVREGKAVIHFNGPVFYNEVQEFNRDLTVSVLREFAESRVKERAEKNEKTNADSAASTSNSDEPPKKKNKLGEAEDGSISILDALSASGLRAMRFALEVPHVAQITANDFSENAVESINTNISKNGVGDKVTAIFGDAVMTMMSHRAIDKRFHAVDLDPYGSAAPFLDSAVQSVADRGVLMVTCTDMAVLCGNTPEACYNKYEAVTTRMKCCHEVALRILLRSIDSHANRYNRYIEPLVSISIDFYVRVFVRLHTGAAKAKNSGAKVGTVLVCSGCHSMEATPLLKKVHEGSSLRYTIPVVKRELIGGDSKCVHCSSSVHQVGPMYLAPIHCKEFVEKMLNRLRTAPVEEQLGTHSRLLGVLTTAREEIDEPLYYEHNQLANVVKVSVPKVASVRSAILNAGYQVSSTHCNPRAFKTNAPPAFLWDIYRQVAKDTNVNHQRHDPQSPGYRILSQDIKNTIDFKLHPQALSQAKDKNMVRFQCNKGKNWGPKAKAKGSVNSAQAGFQITENFSDEEKVKS